MELHLWGKARSLAEAARATGYSRQSIHAWKRDGCPAFADDGSVDLRKLAQWLARNCRGEGGANAEWVAALEPLRFEEHRFAGGRDFAQDCDSIQWQAIRFGNLLRDYGHAEAADHFGNLWRARGEPLVNDFCDWLAERGLAPPLEAAAADKPPPPTAGEGAELTDADWAALAAEINATPEPPNQ